MKSTKKPNPKHQKKTQSVKKEASFSEEEIFSSVVRDLRRPVYELSVPCYILDINYKYLDWNAAFDELFAQHMNLRLGLHPMQFIEHLENRDECIERSNRVFGLGKTPLIDHEPLYLKNSKYGLIKLEKLAVQIRGESGEEKAWMVQLNIAGADHLERLFDDLSKRLESEVIWGIFASSMDSLAPHCKEFKEIFTRQLKGARQAKRILVFGTGSGLGLKELVANASKITLLEFNAVMREHVLKKLSEVDHAPVTFFKQSPFNFRGVLDSSHEFLTTLDGLLRCSDLNQIFREAERVLVEGGSLYFLTLHSQTDLGVVLGLFKKSLSKKNEKSFKVLGDLFQKHSSMLTQHSLGSIRSALEAAGFSIQTWDETAIAGQALWVEARVR